MKLKRRNSKPFCHQKLKVPRVGASYLLMKEETPLLRIKQFKCMTSKMRQFYLSGLIYSPSSLIGTIDRQNGMCYSV